MRVGGICAERLLASSFSLSLFISLHFILYSPITTTHYGVSAQDPGSGDVCKPTMEPLSGPSDTYTTASLFTQYIQSLMGSEFVELDPDRSIATCISFTNFHYRTLDGTHYNFEGDCTYILLEDISYSQFKVSVDNSYACLGASYQLCNERSVTIELAGGYSIMVQGYIAHIKDLSGVLTTYDFHNTTYKTEFLQVSSGTIARKGSFMYIDLNRLGLSLKYSDDDIFFVTVDKFERPELFGGVGGLCGNFNDDHTDDFVNPFGMQMSYEGDFGNSWTNNEMSPGCEPVQPSEHPCLNVSDALRNAAMDICAQIFDCPFNQCAESSAYCAKQTIANCIYQYCSAHNSGHTDPRTAVCNTFQTFALSCSDLGKQIDQWRSEDFCAKECPDGFVYKDCGSSCIHTCKNIHNPVGDDKCNQACSPGCFCPEGTLLNDVGECVASHECTCVYDRVTYQTNDTIQLDCNDCTCRGGYWDCTNYVCDSICEVRGHGHIKTFDGLSLHYPGTCDYVLAQTYEDDEKDIEIILKTICSDPNIPYGCHKALEVNVVGVFGGIAHKIEFEGEDITVNGNLMGTKEYSRSLDGIYVSRVTTEMNLIQGAGIQVMYDKVSLVYIHLSAYYVDLVRTLHALFMPSLCFILDTILRPLTHQWFNKSSIVLCMTTFLFQVDHHK